MGGKEVYAARRSGPATVAKPFKSSRSAESGLRALLVAPPDGSERESSSSIHVESICQTGIIRIGMRDELVRLRPRSEKLTVSCPAVS